MYVERVDFDDAYLDYPTWAQVEEAIRRMSQDESGRNDMQLTSFTHSSAMTIGGGTCQPENAEDPRRDGYMCSVYAEVKAADHDAVEYVLINPQASGNDTKTLTMVDDDVEVQADYVTDTESVLAAAKHFCETGAIHEGYKWEILTYM